MYLCMSKEWHILLDFLINLNSLFESKLQLEHQLKNSGEIVTLLRPFETKNPSTRNRSDLLFVLSR